MPTDDEIRHAQRVAWAGLAPRWEKWDEVIMRQLAPITEAMVEHLEVEDDQQHLDVASGTGEPGLTVAALAPLGHVVLTDLSAEMLDVAGRRAAARNISNIETRVCSADELPFPDERFDSVSVRLGYMFFPDIAKAVAEHARVLLPGGRLCASVWVRPEANPWTAIVMDAVAAEAELPPPVPGGPSMFRCGEPGYLSALFEAEGLRDVEEWDVDVPLVTRSPDEYWQLMSEHVSLVVAALQQVDDAARLRIERTVLAAVGRYQEGGQVAVPGLARCIAATK